MNLYAEYYLPEIDRRIRSSKIPPETEFRSGPLGNYFAKSMLPKENSGYMKTFRDKDPLGSLLDKAVIARFLQHQEKMLELLSESENINLTRTRTSVSISRLIKLRLGDTFRVVIYHEQRHLKQAKRVLIAISSEGPENPPQA